MTATTVSTLHHQAINTIRTLSMDAVQAANSGHPGAPMGAAPMAYVLWTRFLRHNPADPAWPDRDRFVLSAGHASMLLYSLLHLTGYDLPLEELKRFRQWGSKTPGHPEHGLTAGVEVTTGPLGSGISNAVGMAIAERMLAARFNRPGHTIVDHTTYALVSDGDLMEGIASEATSLAGTLGLGKLIFLYDDNEISIEGDTDLSFREDVGKRFEAYGWNVQHVDGNDLEAIEAAIRAGRAASDRPSIIVATTEIAHGSPNKAGSADAHGNALGEDEVRLTKEALGWPAEPPFHIPAETLAEFRVALEQGAAWQGDWQARVEAHGCDFPAEAAEWQRVAAGELPLGWEAEIPAFSAEDTPAMATRQASGKVLNAIAPVLTNLVGGSADLAPSTNTHLSGFGDFGDDSWDGRNLHFGVREHAMGGIVNGIAAHGGLIPYSATFLAFSDWMRGAIRLGALMECRAIYVFTHDSIALGEDGPTHQPVEQLAALRAMPGLVVLRPADANETAAAWKVAIERSGPSLLALTRQGLPVIDNIERVRAGVPRGAYILDDPPVARPDVILIATGSEVSLARDAAALLGEAGLAARVVSMPSWELFAEQPQSYREQVLPPSVPARIAIEAASSFGWERHVGAHGEVVGIDRFGASAPGKVVMEQYGFTASAVAERAISVIERLRAR